MALGEVELTLFDQHEQELIEMESKLKEGHVKEDRTIKKSIGPSTHSVKSVLFVQYDSIAANMVHKHNPNA